MQHPSDAQLLRDYAAHGSDPAFAGIVERHTDLVYSAALRQTGSPELARDLAQSVFTDLARKAGALARPLDEHASLAGWLYQATRFAVLTARREERRRLAREKMVMEQFDPAPAPDDTWAALAPVLDEAMAELGDADREAVVLRYFKNLDFSAVAVALGVSEAAAQKRVSRAVERLRELIAKRGVTTGASGLVILISANAVLVAPAGLSAAITAGAIAAAATTVATSATIISLTAMQKALLATVLAAVVGVGIYEANHASTERTRAQTLEQQNAALSNQLADLARERDETARQVAALRNALAESNRPSVELLRLRGEVTRLREETRQRPQPQFQADKGGPERTIPAGLITVYKAETEVVLSILAEISGIKFDLSPQAAAFTHVGKITYTNTHDMRVEEVIRSLETAFREQAGFIFSNDAPGHATILFDSTVMKGNAEYWPAPPPGAR